MSADLSQLEDTLRAAYSDVAATVRPEDISELAPAPASPLRLPAAATSRRGPALAAAAAVLLIIITATVIPNVLPSGSRNRGGATAEQRVPSSHLAYVVSTSQGNSQSDQLVPVNLVTGRALRPIPLHVKGYLCQVAISSHGKLAYVLTARAQLIPVNLATGMAYPPIDLGGVAQNLVITPDGKTAYVLEPPYGVVVVNLATRTPLGFIKVHDAERFVLTPSGTALYVLSNTVSRTMAGSSLTAIDTTTNTTAATIDLRQQDNGPFDLVMAPDGKTVYTAFTFRVRGSFRSPARMRSTYEIVPVDVTSNTEGKPVVSGAVPGEPAQGLTISPDSHRLYVIQGTDQTVFPVDTRTGTVLQPIRLGPPPRSSWGGVFSAWGGVFAPGGKTLYILSYDMSSKTGRYLAARMTPIDTVTGAVGTPISIPPGQDAIAFIP